MPGPTWGTPCFLTRKGAKLEHGVTGRRNFSQICRGGARNKEERNETNILTLGRKSTFAPSVTGFHSENRRFRSARGGSREGGRAFEGAHGKDTDRGGRRSSHLPPPRERPTGGGVRSTSGADHRPAGGSPRTRGGGYKTTLVSGRRLGSVFYPLGAAVEVPQSMLDGYLSKGQAVTPGF